MRRTLAQKIEEAEKRGISIPKELAEGKNIVGVYEIFKVMGDERECLYIGKSTNIAGRLFDTMGHIHKYLNGSSDLVPNMMRKSMIYGYRIEVEIIKVDYYDTSFSRAANRLALAELKEIVKYQEMGQCLCQRPEGVGKNEKKFWEDKYKKEA